MRRNYSFAAVRLRLLYISYTQHRGTESTEDTEKSNSFCFWQSDLADQRKDSAYQRAKSELAFSVFSVSSVPLCWV